MSKQEEIREHLIELLEQTTTHEPPSKVVDAILWVLNEDGVVIKVKCLDCEWSQFGEEHVGMTPCHSCNSTGYTVEPLIKEEW